jgi:hypothetical protein
LSAFVLSIDQNVVGVLCGLFRDGVARSWKLGEGCLQDLDELVMDGFVDNDTLG